MHRVSRRCVFTPQLLCGETYGVDVLAFLAQKMGVAVGKDVDAVISDDDADLAACVPRQTRVTRGIDVACTNALSHLERRPHCWIVARSDPSIEPAVRCRKGQR